MSDIDTVPVDRLKALDPNRPIREADINDLSANVRFGSKADMCSAQADVRFSNRPVWVKRFQTIHRYGVDVAHGLVLLFGIGTKALPSWDSKTRWNNLIGGLAVS